MSWIKFRTSLIMDGRVNIVKRKCNASSVTVIGALVTLWSLGDRYADENGVLVGYCPQDINSLLEVENFCESLPSDWIDLSGEWVKLPEYHEHNGSTAKKRAQTKKRVAKSRTCNASSVTKALPDKIREEKNIYNPPTPLRGESGEKVRKEQNQTTHGAVCNLKPHKGVPFRDVPTDFLEWMISKNTNQSADAAKELARRKSEPRGDMRSIGDVIKKIGGDR